MSPWLSSKWWYEDARDFPEGIVCIYKNEKRLGWNSDGLSSALNVHYQHKFVYSHSSFCHVNTKVCGYIFFKPALFTGMGRKSRTNQHMRGLLQPGSLQRGSQSKSLLYCCCKFLVYLLIACRVFANTQLARIDINNRNLLLCKHRFTT